MIYSLNKQLRWATMALLLVVCISFVLTALPPVPVQAAIDGFTSDGLDATQTSDNPWTISNGNNLSWSYKTIRTGNFWNYKYTSRSNTLTFANNSGKEQMLFFTYSISLNGGSVTIGGVHYADTGGTQVETSIPMKADTQISIVVTTAASKEGYSSGTTVTLTNVRLEIPSVTTTFAPADSTMGSYTVNGSAVTESMSDTKLANQAIYSLVAAPKEHYVFYRWMLNGSEYSTADELEDELFSSGGNVSAEFMADPLHAIASASGSYGLDDLLDINSRYYHNSDRFRDAKKLTSSDSCYYSAPSSTQVADHYDSQYVPFLQWAKTSDNAMSVSYSGTADGEWCTATANSYHAANMITNVIRIYAVETCTISFDYTQSVSNNGSSNKTNTANLHVYVSSSAEEEFKTIVSKGTIYADASGMVECTLTKGQYLYIYAHGFTQSSSLKLGAGYSSMTFSYSATISNFTVSYNDNLFSLSTSFQDNVNTALPGGTLIVGTETHSADANGQVVVDIPENQTVKLTVYKTPANYRLLGWQVGNDLILDASVECTITADTQIKAIFIPNVVTITVNADKTVKYQYKNTSGKTVDFSGQYVARNADATAFYSTLEDAFSKTNQVVLLGNVTIVGEYTIASGKTLVVPCNMVDVMPKDSSGNYLPGNPLPYDKKNPPQKPLIASTLTINGNLIVEGNAVLLVSGYQDTGTGGPYGISSYGTLHVNGTVTLKNSASLYGYGRVTGNGTIYANTGSQVHELCEFKDKPHPQTMLAITNDKDHAVLPFNIFYVNTIEAKTVYQTGATLDAHLALQYDEITQTSIRMLGTSSSMFILNGGTVTKYFDLTEKQIVIQVDEGATVETGSLSIKMNVVFNKVPYDAEMDSADYFLPLSSGYHIRIAGTCRINHRFKLLPGAVMNVTSTGTLTIGDNGALVLYRLNDYDYRKVVSGKEAMGFSVAGYPVDISRHNKFIVEKVLVRDNLGSAKLNVDGKVYANGGLYVTESLLPEFTTEDETLAYKTYTYYQNGYNVLTGTGMIDMGSRANPLTTIYENLGYTEDRNVHTQAVAVVPLKGIQDKNASEDIPENYTQLSNVVYGLLNSNGLYIWTSADSEGWNDSYIATNVELGNSLNMHFAFNHADINASSNYYIRINGGEPIYIQDWKAEDSNADGVVDYYVVIYKGLAAKQMTDTVFVALYNADGVTLDCWSDSIRDYALRIRDKYQEHDDLQMLIVDMLNYGAACQTLFGYKTNDLANAGITGTGSDYSFDDVSTADPDDSYFVGSNLITTGNIQFAVFPKDGVDATTATYEFTNHWGTVVKGDLQPAVDANGTTYYYVDRLVVADAAEEGFKITIKIGDQVVYEDSVEGYCARMYAKANENQKAAFLAFMKFSLSANTYLEGDPVA